MDDVVYRDVHEMKDRELEHVRYRSIQAFARDPTVVAVMNKVRADARSKLAEPRVGIADAFEGHGLGEFISKAKRRCLQVTALKKVADDDLRSQYSELLSKLPATAHRKLDRRQLETTMGRAKAINQLVMKHDGEIAELDRFRAHWALTPVPDSVKEQPGHE